MPDSATRAIEATEAPRRRKPRYFRHSFAQEGEDLILASFFEGRRDGFFVDVGAHHPRRFSNTYHFYLFRGWRGINIDATPGSMTAFRRARPQDINIEAAISDERHTLEFFVFNESALNTFDPALAAERDGFQSFAITRKVSINTAPLREILDQRLPTGTKIDFLSVDVEGLDLNVLRSNNWEKYRPTVVLAEDVSMSNWSQIGASPTTLFLKQQGYEPFASTFRTIFYRRLQP